MESIIVNIMMRAKTAAFAALCLLVTGILLFAVAGCSHKEAPTMPSKAQANNAPPEVQQEYKNAPH